MFPYINNKRNNKLKTVPAEIANLIAMLQAVFKLQLM